MFKTSVILVGLLCGVRWTNSVEIEERSHSSKDGRKLFGGYRITPRYCEPTRELAQELKGPNICMFNHECIQRNGFVVGACMDGFLFGACCQLPVGSAGELIDHVPADTNINSNTLYYTKSPSHNVVNNNNVVNPNDVGHITSSGVSKITQSLLYGNRPLNSGVLPTAADNTVVQVQDQFEQFVTTGVTHPSAPDTVVVTAGSNDIIPDHFNKPATQDPAEDRRTTNGIELTTQAYIPDVSPYIHISISNAPSYYTPAPIVGGDKPIFRPKPPKPNDQYVLVPTINHQIKNKTDSIDTIVSIVNLFNDTRQPVYGSPSTNPPNIYLYSTATATTTTKRPSTTSGTTSKATTITTSAPRRTTTKLKLTTKKRLGTTTKKTTTKKTPQTTTDPITTSKKPYQYSSTTYRPLNTSKRPPSTSYVYSSTVSKRPGSGTLTTVPGYAVTRPANAPTIIVLGSTLSNTSPEPITHQYAPTKYTTLRPSTYTASTSTKHPVTVTINNHITQHIHNTSERPSPTVLITPKPSGTSAPTVNTYTSEQAANGDNQSNFPPVRNPNLNMSNPIFDQDNDIATPDFVEDAALNTKVESFVNKIIAGLQEPFDGLKDIVYSGANKTETTTKKPVRKTTTRKPTTRAPLTTTTERVKTTTKKVKTTKPTEKKKVTTTTIPTTESYIEHDDVSQDYRAQCGIRPLLKSGRIVGGKGASFGAFPWQVLVRESTWLGLFTKNKCGGVLISNKYVMTAAHCQPGFLASLVAVFGEFDISGDLEAKRAVSRNVKRVIVHRQYDAATFENDLALLELEHPIQFDAHIVPICLPRDHEDFTGRMATVTGWGRLKYGGGVPSVLQEVQVPIMENVVCQEMFRTAGHQKVILESFLCAGYANGQKDSCEGDSGGPLVLQRPDGRYQLAGTVSHGIKCAAPYLPGVYMRTTFYKPWIESITGVH